MSQSHRQLGIADLTVAVREVRRVTGCLELVVGGSGALVALGARAGELLRTVDFDIGITQEGTLQGVTDFESKLGKQSEFVESHGFYVEHAGESLLTDLLPAGWRERAARFTIEEVSVLCLAPVDIAINKLDAARPKDFEHLSRMLHAGLVTYDEIEHAISHVPFSFLMPKYREALAKVRTMI
jgi:hypothetical protein